MGVPGLAGWLIRRYPWILQAIEEGQELPQCDELYIDFNQIIHGCTHPSWRDKPLESELEALLEMDAVVSRLVNLLKPTTLLFVAVDGVAPVAKIAQQRERRYTSALRAAVAGRAEEAARREMESELGVVVAWRE